MPEIYRLTCCLKRGPDTTIFAYCGERAWITWASGRRYRCSRWEAEWWYDKMRTEGWEPHVPGRYPPARPGFHVESGPGGAYVYPDGRRSTGD